MQSGGDCRGAFVDKNPKKKCMGSPRSFSLCKFEKKKLNKHREKKRNYKSDQLPRKLKSGATKKSAKAGIE